MKQQIPNHITIYTKKITNSMYTYTQTEHKYTYRSNGLKSKINSTDQMSSEDQTVHRKKSNEKKNDQIRIKQFSNGTKFTKP